MRLPGWAMWNDASLLDEAESLLERPGDLIPRDKSWDIIGGSAGCALALRSLHMPPAFVTGSWILYAPVANICCKTPKTPAAARLAAQCAT